MADINSTAIIGNNTAKTGKKRKWLKISAAILLLLAIFIIKYGKQCYILFAIHNVYGKKLSFLELKPEKHEIAEVPKETNYIFSAFGYAIKLPVESKPELIDNELAKAAIVQNKFAISISKPLQNPLGYFQNVKIGNIGGNINNLRQLNAELGMHFKNNFDFINQSFYSTPSFTSIFKTIEESTLLLYQQTTKYHHIMLKKTSERMFYIETRNCKVFQVGDPELGEIVALWIYPDVETELEIMIAVKNGSLKQSDIDEIVYSFGLSEAAN